MCLQKLNYGDDFCELELDGFPLSFVITLITQLIILRRLLSFRRLTPFSSPPISLVSTSSPTPVSFPVSIPSFSSSLLTRRTRRSTRLWPLSSRSIRLWRRPSSPPWVSIPVWPSVSSFSPQIFRTIAASRSIFSAPGRSSAFPALTGPNNQTSVRVPCNWSIRLLAVAVFVPRAIDVGLLFPPQFFDPKFASRAFLLLLRWRLDNLRIPEVRIVARFLKGNKTYHKTKPTFQSYFFYPTEFLEVFAYVFYCYFSRQFCYENLRVFAAHFWVYKLFKLGLSVISSIFEC